MRRTQRGAGLIEALIALAILGILSLGVLPMFSLSLMTDKGSAARTDLIYKCQQVVETIRYVQYLRNGGVTGGSAPTNADTGIPDSPTIGTKYVLPYKTGAYWPYWGPAGANIMEDPNGGPYQIFYVFGDPGAGYWTVTVTAQPAQKATVATGQTPGTASYLGVQAQSKSVEYVAWILKPSS
jgi:type II secretory pathway pseudopilin PulG